MAELYDSIGKTYTTTREADHRITERLVSLLGLPSGSAILDVGAGTGNYSHELAAHGYEVTALEPSKVMREQGKLHSRLIWREGAAEHLPFAEQAFDGVVMTLCLHHFIDWRQSIREARRVVGPGPVVILTFDPERNADFWLLDYFPCFRAKDSQCFPKMEEFRRFSEEHGITCDVAPFLLPPDLKDHFAAAGWARPEIYLEENFRAGISSFAKASEKDVQRGLTSLAQDLKSGEWDRRYSAYRSATALDVGYVFVTMR